MGQPTGDGTPFEGRVYSTESFFDRQGMWARGMRPRRTTFWKRKREGKECAGVLGPLIGADLLHLREIEKIATGVASIGGAGTFDGIILSGIMAAYLA